MRPHPPQSTILFHILRPYISGTTFPIDPKHVKCLFKSLTIILSSPCQEKVTWSTLFSPTLRQESAAGSLTKKGETVNNDDWKAASTLWYPHGRGLVVQGCDIILYTPRFSTYYREDNPPPPRHTTHDHMHIHTRASGNDRWRSDESRSEFVIKNLR